MTSAALKRRIASLLDKKVDRGCTEAEALAAAAKAAELMREHGLSEADLVIDEKAVKSRSVGKSVRDSLWRMVAHCTNTASIFVQFRVPPSAEVAFVGNAPGPEIAVYLYKVLNRAIDNAIAAFKAETFYRRRRTNATRRKAVADFTHALVMRLQVRLYELFEDAIDPAAKDVAGKALDARYPGNAVINRPDRDIRFGEAAWAGVDAAERVNLSHGLQGGSEQVMIGRGDDR